MRLIVTSFVVAGLFIARAQAQDTTNAPAPAAAPSAAATAPAAGTPAQPSLTPPPDQPSSAPAPAPSSAPAPAPSVAPAPAPAPSAAPAPAPAPAPTVAPAPAPAPAENQPASATTSANPPTATSPQPAPAKPQTPHADHFHPDAIIDRCLDGVTLSQERFNRLFSGEVVEFEGTVAGIKHDESLIVFHGGGVYPDNWDVQLKPHGQKFTVGHTYRVVFRLTHLRDEPLAGYSFRGIVLSRTSDD